MLDAIDCIESFTSGYSYDEFCQDQKTMSAVRDQIMIIGEAVNHVPGEILSEYTEVPWRDIVGMRNVLVHSYFRTDPELLFLVANDRLGSLSPIIKNMISKYSR